MEAEVHGSNFRNSLKFQKALVRWAEGKKQMPLSFGAFSLSFSKWDLK